MEELPFLQPLLLLAHSRKVMSALLGLITAVVLHFIPGVPDELAYGVAGVLAIVIPFLIAYEDGQEKRARVVAVLESEIEENLPAIEELADKIKSELEAALEEFEPDEINAELVAKLLDTIKETLLPES